MENTFFSPERNITISAVVPISLKNKLLLEASKLGISLSEFLYHLIENSGCNAFSSNELTKKNLEIEALQKQISELEEKLLQKEEEGPEEEEPEEEEEEETPFDRLNDAYCNLKKFAFQNYSKSEIYKEADKLHKTELTEKTLPELQVMKSKGLENVANWLISQLKHSDKINKAYFLEGIEKAFNEACQMDKIKFEPLTALDEKNIYFSIKDRVPEKFGNILEEIERYTLRESDFNLLKECDVKETTYFLDKSFTENLLINAEFYKEKIERKTLKETKPEEKQEEKPETATEPTPADDYKPKNKEERILHEQYSKGVEYLTKYELNKLGFDTGFFSNLTARGGKYGKYELTKAPSEKVFVLRLNPKYKGNAKKDNK